MTDDEHMLVTDEEVRDLADEGLRLDEPEIAGPLKSICAGVSRRIEGHLGRTLLARVVTQRIGRADWDVSKGAYARYADAWPVSTVLNHEESGVTVVEDGARFALGERLPMTLRYVAGYRREGEDQADVQARLETETQPLPALPPVLPYDICEAALALIIYRWMKRDHSSYGQQRTIERNSELSVSIDVDDPRFEDRTLAALSHHMHVLA